MVEPGTRSGETTHVTGYPYDYEQCNECGGSRGGRIIPLDVRRCDCRRRGSFGAKNLQEADPREEMTFETITDPHPTLAKAMGRCKEIVAGKAERGLFMFGEPGLGKTHIAVATVRDAKEHGLRGGYFNLAELVGSVQETYGKHDGEDTRRTIIEDVAFNDVVVLDDIGKERSSNDVDAIVYELINALYIKRRMLVASSNMPADDFAQRYDDAVKSRLRGLCDRITVLGEDRRPREWSWD